MPLLQHLLFVLLGIVLPLLLLRNAWRQRQAERTPRYWSQRMKIRMYFLNGGFLWLLALLVMGVWYHTEGSLTGIGLGWGKMPYDLSAVLVLSGFLTIYLIDFFRQAGQQQRREETRQTFRELGFLPATATQFLNFIFLAVAAGFCEEVIYRGFMITYLEELLGPSPWTLPIALLLAGTAFGAGHFYQGGKAVLKIILMALLFGYFFWQTRTLWPLMLLHTAIDIAGGLLSWWLLRPPLED